MASKQTVWEMLETEGHLLNVTRAIHALGFAEPQVEAIYAELQTCTFRWTKGVNTLGVYQRWTSRATGEQTRSEIGVARIIADIADQRADTILHEVAHLIAAVAFDEPQGHSANWREIATALGAAPEASTKDERIEAIAKTRQKVVAVCTDCGQEFLGMRAWSKRKGVALREGRLTHNKGCGPLALPS